MSAPASPQDTPDSAQKRIGFFRRNRGTILFLAFLLVEARLLVWGIQFVESRSIYRQAQARERFHYAAGLAHDIFTIAYLRAVPSKDYDFPAEIRRASTQIAKANHMTVPKLSGLLADARKDAELFDHDHIHRARFALLAGDYLAANSAADNAGAQDSEAPAQRWMIKGDARIAAHDFELAEIDYRAAFLAAKYSPPQLRDEVTSKLARVLARNRKFAESAVFWRQALDIRKTLDGHDSQTEANAQQWVTMQARNHIEFSPEHIRFREKLKKLARDHGPYSEETYSAAVEIAQSLIKNGSREEWEQYVLLAHEIKTNPRYRQSVGGFLLPDE